MSLHAQLNPEVIERLRKQKRNSSIGSLVIGFLVVALLALITGLFMLPVVLKPKVPEFTIYIPPKLEPDKPDEPKVKPTVEKKPTPPRQATVKPLLANTISEVNLPVPVVVADMPSVEFGTTTDFGSSIGLQPSTSGFDPIVGVPGKRCSERDRRERLEETGGTMRGERAVIRALDYLQITQNDDGSWGDKYQSAMTGFALLAYLGHCETPRSVKYGDTVSLAMTYLTDLGMRNGGRLSVMPENSIQWVYEHAIATYALAEAYTFCKQLRHPFPNLKEVTKMAGDRIGDGHADRGGWNYKYSNSPNQGDNSVGFWQIQALKACKHTGIWPDSKFKRTARNAVEFLEKVQGEDGAIGYRTDPKRSPDLTGGGVLCMQIWGEGDSRAAKKGIDWIRKNSKFKWADKSANLYYHYYNAQAMINAGGRDWDWYNAMFRDQLIDAQNEDGSWRQNVGNHGPINTHMATCLAALTLEVYYRFLPGTNK